MLLASLTLCFSPLSCVHTAALDAVRRSRSEKMDMQWGKKSGFTSLLSKSSIKPVRLPRTCTMLAQGQYLTLTGLFGHTKHACLSPPPPHPQAHQQRWSWLPVLAEQDCLMNSPPNPCNCTTPGSYRVLWNRAWETLNTSVVFTGS